MKKMLIGAFAGAFALCAQAEITTVDAGGNIWPEGTNSTGTAFSNLQEGSVTVVGFDDDGNTQGDVYWYQADGENAAIVTNMTDQAETPVTQSKALYIEAEKRLYRTVLGGAGLDSTGIGFENGTQLAVTNSTLFFDSKVFFTATDTAPSNIDPDDKLVIWLYGGEDESGTFGVSTNLVITAGKYEGGSVVSTNYVVSADNLSIEPNTWHQLTIKALVRENLDVEMSAPGLGFEVLVDDTLVKCGENEEEVSVFPSLKKYQGSVASTYSLMGVAFEGTGAIDDISFHAETPEVVETFNYTVTVVDEADSDALSCVTATVNNVEYEVYGANAVTALPVYDGNMTLTAVLNITEVKIADNEGWTASQDGLTYTKTVDISGYAADSNQSLTITLVEAGGDEPDNPVADDGSGNSFTVPKSVVDETLAGKEAEDGKDLLNSRQVKSTDPDTGAVTYSTLTYGQAYALGVLDENGNIGDVPAVTISFDADGKPVVKMLAGAALKDTYTITCELEYKDDLGVTGGFAGFNPAVTAEIGENLTDATASKPTKRFYQVKVSISDPSSGE